MIGERAISPARVLLRAGAVYLGFALVMLAATLLGRRGWPYTAAWVVAGIRLGLALGAAAARAIPPRPYLR